MALETLHNTPYVEMQGSKRALCTLVLDGCIHMHLQVDHNYKEQQRIPPRHRGKQVCESPCTLGPSRRRASERQLNVRKKGKLIPLRDFQELKNYLRT